jgi:predicted nucleotidyltransferase
MSDRPNVSVGDRDVALANEILRTTVGSGVHGMAIPGHDDNDEMGVYIETPEQLLGLPPAFDQSGRPYTSEHYVSRTKPEGERSGPGDTDLMMYSLRKYLRLATAGNPTVLTPLFAPASDVLTVTGIGIELRALAPKILSRRAGWRHLGYLDDQRQRMVGGGKQNRVPNRPELIAAHGYDTKYASHALRLGLQGLELMRTGRLVLPMRPTDLAKCMEVKTGRVDFETALAKVDDVRQRLAWTMESSRGALPEHPDMDAVNNWMVTMHQRWWHSQGAL